MSNILILGGAGFIGSHIAKRLLDDDHHLTIVDNFSKRGYLDENLYNDRRARIIKKDIRKMKKSEFGGYNFVLCLAARIGGIGYLNKIPYQIARDNTEILTHAIECTAAASPKAIFYFFSSSLVFERANKEVSESSLYEQKIPKIVYSLQKLFGEYIVESANKELGLGYVIIRPFNIIGSERPQFDSSGRLATGMAHVIPDFVYRAMIKQSPFEIMGDGQQKRTYTHVDDFSNAIALMIKNKVANENFNICGEETVSSAELAKRIWRLVNPGTRFPGFKHLPAPQNDVRFRKSRTDKARKLLGWKPAYGLDRILEDSIATVRESMKSSGR